MCDVLATQKIVEKMCKITISLLTINNQPKHGSTLAGEVPGSNPDKGEKHSVSNLSYSGIWLICLPKTVAYYPVLVHD